MDVTDIKVDAQGYRALLKGSGVIIKDMKTPQGMIVFVKDNLIIYDENIRLPLRLMIGVIEVASDGEGVGTFLAVSKMDVEAYRLCQASLYHALLNSSLYFFLTES